MDKALQNYNGINAAIVCVGRQCKGIEHLDGKGAFCFNIFYGLRILSAHLLLSMTKYI
jgi:hypothetical protein